MRGCTALESLDLDIACFEEGLFEEIAATHPSLKTLGINDANSRTLTDEVLEGVFTNPATAFSGLHNLSLTTCERLSDITLHNIAASPTRTTLISLDLSFSFLNLDAIEALIDACPKLTELTYHLYDLGGDDEESRVYEAYCERMYERLGVLMQGRRGSFDGYLQ